MGGKQQVIGPEGWSSWEGPPPKLFYPLANALSEYLLGLGYVLHARLFTAYYKGPRVTIAVYHSHPEFAGAPGGRSLGFVDVGPGPTEMEVMSDPRGRREFDAANPTAFEDLVAWLDRK